MRAAVMKKEDKTQFYTKEVCGNSRFNGKRRNFIVSMTAVLFMMTVCLSATSVVFANSKKEEQTYRYYTSIEIKPGDSLWSIASEYCFDMDMSVNDYIQEIKTLNHLSSDAITSGQYLTVMYVSNDYK